MERKEGKKKSGGGRDVVELLDFEAVGWEVVGAGVEEGATVVALW